MFSAIPIKVPCLDLEPERRPDSGYPPAIRQRREEQLRPCVLLREEVLRYCCDCRTDWCPANTSRYSTGHPRGTKFYQQEKNLHRMSLPDWPGANSKTSGCIHVGDGVCRPHSLYRLLWRSLGKGGVYRGTKPCFTRSTWAIVSLFSVGCCPTITM